MQTTYPSSDVSTEVVSDISASFLDVSPLKNLSGDCLLKILSSGAIDVLIGRLYLPMIDDISSMIDDVAIERDANGYLRAPSNFMREFCAAFPQLVFEEVVPRTKVGSRSTPIPRWTFVNKDGILPDEPQDKQYYISNYVVRDGVVHAIELDIVTNNDIIDFFVSRGYSVFAGIQAKRYR